MFSKDFYPTPNHVIERMVEGLELQDKTILDPSAGSGAILDYCANYSKDLLAYEKEPDLSHTLRGKGYHMLGDDFLKSTRRDLSSVDVILMNPPFSADVHHIVHAWKNAPSGCYIVALCNSESIRNQYSMIRKELSAIIDGNGVYEDIGAVFMNAQRKTDVEVSLIRLHKPPAEGFDYSMFFLEPDYEISGSGLIEYNEVRAIVNRYTASLKAFEKIEKELRVINDIAEKVGTRSLTCSFGDRFGFVDKTRYTRELQSQSWRALFRKFNLERYFTSNVSEKLEKFISSQEVVPFTMRNIYVVMDMIFQTREENLTQSLVSAVDNFTKHHHANRYNVEGWKTNSGYMLNKRFIIGDIVNTDWGFKIGYGSARGEDMEDLVKVLCNITGVSYETIPYVREWVDNEKETNTWYQLKNEAGEPVFLRYKFYLKGSMHVEFTDLDAWEKLNRMYGKAKGQTLPEKL